MEQKNLWLRWYLRKTSATFDVELLVANGMHGDTSNRQRPPWWIKQQKVI